MALPQATTKAPLQRLPPDSVYVNNLQQDNKGTR
jgi:hypothetical protein